MPNILGQIACVQKKAMVDVFWFECALGPFFHSPLHVVEDKCLWPYDISPLLKDKDDNKG